MTNKRFYCFIAFINGGIILALELLGARILASYYGTSLFVWASVLATVLCSLATGYFVGGYYIDKYKSEFILFLVTGINAALIFFIPVLASKIMEATYVLGLRMGALVSSLLLFYLPLAGLGMISPMIIRVLTRDINYIGRVSGAVYGISTLGGIAMTFLMGFYVIPKWGITIPLLALVVILALMFFIYCLYVKKIRLALMTGAVFIIMFMLNPKKHSDYGRISNIKLLYYSEGLLGKVSVLSYPMEHPTTKKIVENRLLLVNWITQTHYNKTMAYSLWRYIHTISTIASIKPPGSRILIMGLGGGSLANECIGLGFDVTVCDLDSRMKKVAEKYFDLDERCKVIIDDARHYLRTAKGQYDIIAFDVFAGENTPAHLLTVESLEEMKRILSSDGILIINQLGELDRESENIPAMYNTLHKSGFEVQLTPGDTEIKPHKSSELIFIASLKSFPLNIPALYRQNACCQYKKIPVPIPVIIIPEYFSNQILLTDDNPIMELLDIPSVENWRKKSIENFYVLKDAKIPYFK